MRAARTGVGSTFAEMGTSPFAGLAVADVAADLARNIVSLHTSQDLFDDLSADPADWARAQEVEEEVKPPFYRSSTPLLDRPFEDAAWFSAIAWPFRNWQQSRFSDGSYGVWYGADSVETTVWETVWHWYHGLLADAGFQQEGVVAERKVYAVACHAALLDFRAASARFAALLDARDYRYAQSVGARIHHEGHPGLVIQSVRRPAGENFAVFTPRVLADPRLTCQLAYRLQGQHIVVEKQPGRSWLRIALSAL